jgi:hypothetical protein
MPVLSADEIDAIAPKREMAQREMERRIVAQMLTSLDDLSGGGLADDDQPNQESSKHVNAKHVVVIGKPRDGPRCAHRGPSRSIPALPCLQGMLRLPAQIKLCPPCVQGPPTGLMRWTPPSGGQGDSIERLP